MEKKKDPKLDEMKENMQKDYPEVYKIVEDLKDCRCSIKFKHKS
jgi:hypothetical protein